jgi:hypothetical protein
MPLGLELLGQAPDALACPTQGALRMTPRVEFDKRMNRLNQPGIVFTQFSSARL